MSYSYATGDGKGALTAAEPANSDLIAASCAQAIRQIKEYLRDTDPDVDWYSKTEVNALIAAIPAPGSFNSYPVRAATGGTQSIPTDGTVTKLQFDSEALDPSNVFDIATYEFTAPATGYYRVSVSTQFDNDTGTAASMQVALGLAVNGVAVSGVGDIDSTPSPTGARWSPGFSTIVQLTSGQKLTATVEVTDGGSHLIDFTSGSFSIERLST